MSKTKYKEVVCNYWDELMTRLRKFPSSWVFRGQTHDWPLTTTLERACLDNEIALADAPGIESQMIRSFRRHYSGPESDSLQKDKLYCLALMQHHGAPARLLDFTYSPFIGAYFALERKSSKGTVNVIWAMDGYWCNKQARKIVGTKLIDQRNSDLFRNDLTFHKLYMRKKPKRFIFFENPFFFNTRLGTQIGVFLCPGDITSSFEDNLRALDGWQESNNVIKIHCTFSTKERLNALDELNRMGINKSTLFPGIDGFAASYNTRLRFLLEQHRRKAGLAL